MPFAVVLGTNFRFNSRWPMTWFLTGFSVMGQYSTFQPWYSREWHSSSVDFLMGNGRSATIDRCSLRVSSLGFLWFCWRSPVLPIFSGIIKCTGCSHAHWMPSVLPSVFFCIQAPVCWSWSNSSSIGHRTGVNTALYFWIKSKYYQKSPIIGKKMTDLFNEKSKDWDAN